LIKCPSFTKPPAVKANGGMFLIDDFGRQQMRPTDLLNPLDRPLETESTFPLADRPDLPDAF